MLSNPDTALRSNPHAAKAEQQAAEHQELYQAQSWLPTKCCQNKRQSPQPNHETRILHRGSEDQAWRCPSFSCHPGHVTYCFISPLPACEVTALPGFAAAQPCHHCVPGHGHSVGTQLTWQGRRGRKAGNNENKNPSKHLTCLSPAPLQIHLHSKDRHSPFTTAG